jgi:uncharacterized membrane protein YozB (DUF420 family)
MIGLRDLPTLNAILNGLSAVFLVMGYAFIRRGRIAKHRASMIAAFVVSILFLASYLTYHFNAGTTRFQGTGVVRPVYFTILLTHTVLAALVPFLAVISLFLGLKGRYERHRRISRVTLPVWLYVSVTGVIIYLMLYHLFPSAPA